MLERIHFWVPWISWSLFCLIANIANFSASRLVKPNQVRGGVKIKIRKKMGNIPPPFLSDNSESFLKSELFEKCWHPLSLRTYWRWKSPRTDIWKALLRQIYIENGRIKCFNFHFSGGGLRVIYNSVQTFLKIRDNPPGFENSQMERSCFILSYRADFALSSWNSAKNLPKPVQFAFFYL